MTIQQSSPDKTVLQVIDVKSELIRARREHYAIGAFNTNNLEVTKAICQAATKFDAPILVQTTPSAIEYAGLRQIFDIITTEIINTKIKAAIHLDHAKDFSIISHAIRAGYRSIMFDGSKLPYRENVHLTSKVVNFAHSYGASVEAEIGVISHEEGGHLSGKAELSSPLQVKEFVKLTGVDSIAVSVGNEHGAPKGEHVDFNLLEKISLAVDIPLVMHGASGLTAGDIREAISFGVAKFNIDTKIKKVFTHELETSEASDYRDAMKEGMAEVEKVVENYIKLFSNN
ncbi:MAG: class II fructose-bisphosphate aldolase [Patescibacteria group bacterium]